MGHYQASFRDNDISWVFLQGGEIYSLRQHMECVDIMITKKQLTYDLCSQRK